ncbi:MAG: CYTH domain-containing protein [Clostridiales bacterium]|nr:CYTH domain-containing protein [Clostridiales bacterium]
MLEREIRYKIDEDIKTKIINSSIKVEDNQKCIDLCMGLYGFDSLDKLGYIIRIRKKNGKVFIESKKRLENSTWNEELININTIKEGYDFLSNIGLKPYLYINRNREVREIEKAIICIDEIDLLGTYVEFELKENCQFEDIQEYIKQVGITTYPDKLYGDIFKEKMNDLEFKIEFENNLNKFLENN